MDTIHIRKYQPKFTQVANVVLQDPELSLGAKGLYAYLYSKPDGWEFHYEAMSKELRESEAKIRSLVKELITKRYIVRRQKNEAGVFGGIIYDFIDPIYEEVPCDEKTVHGKIPYAENTVCGKTGTLNNTDILSNTDNISKKENITKERKLTEYSEEFEKFWELFPKRRAGSKQKAYLAYKKALDEKRGTPDKIHAAVEKYRNSEEVRKGYAKGCAAWLNDDRFNDEYKSKWVF